MQKRGQELTGKSLMAIAIVIFVAIFIFTMFSNRYRSEEQKQNFNKYYLSGDFYFSLFGNPDCSSVGKFGKDSWQTPISGLLSIDKLYKYNKLDMDAPCLTNTQFLYSMEILEFDTNQRWHIGLQDEPTWADRIIDTTYYVSLMYDPGNITQGRATLKAYFGMIPEFYGLIKQTCYDKESKSIRLDSKYEISYINTNNTICIDNDCFNSLFGCKVNNFLLQSGKYLIYLNYDNVRQELNVIR